ncbi:uncharacterized protein LOC117123487 [Anneissia japonica]|uniref:uncharacterized protein LOC117123487 n=1 Tax=Anneissia japonica TaxID=1529436 RepID=UPI0014257C64|nr:uncharacterized protein LOC117123487 [Anneissia japonica]
MTIVGIQSSWSACGDQLLDNLLYINRLPSEEIEMCLQSTELRPENLSSSERCQIVLTIHNNMALNELCIWCSARHIEVYEGHDSYLETVKGKAKQSNGNNLYWHSFVCERPLDNITLKFVSLQKKEKLELTGIWLALEQSHHVPDNSKLVNMEQVDRMLLTEQVETSGQAMLRQLISSLPANPPPSTTPSQTNPLLPMMLQMFTKSATSQAPEARKINTLEHFAKQLLCDQASKDKSAKIGCDDDQNLSDKLKSVEFHEEKYSSEATSSEMEKEEINKQAVSTSSVTCSCGANLEARLTRVLEEMETRLQAKFQEMDDYQHHMDRKFQMLENKFQDLMKENDSLHKGNT